MPEDKASRPSTVTVAYLLLYNVAQVIGWSMIGLQMVSHFRKTGSKEGLYTEVQFLLEIFQTGAFLEVLHAALGLVKTNPMLALTQLSSRVFIVWHVHYVPTVQNSIGPSLFLTAWVITEIVRYAFYAINLVSEVPYFLQWCRYTFFIVLYPMGVSGELISVWLSLDYVGETGLFSTKMPNIVNMSFNYYYVLCFIMLLYIPNFPPLYMHMVKQRSKVIGGQDKPKEA